MTIRQFRYVLPFALALAPVAAIAQETDYPAVRERIEELVRENFYDAERAASFALPEAASSEEDSFDAMVAEALAGLEVSHTGRYTPDRIDYFELMDIYNFAVTDELERLFPPDGEVTYPGIGLIAQKIDGSHFAVDVYHAGSAARAGVQEGDEILAVDGEPWSEIGSFEGKVGEGVTLSIRRQANAEPEEIAVKVEAIKPNDMFTASISESIRIIEQDGHRIGYVRMWSFTSEATRWLLYEELGTGRLADADALVIDLRSRWGGAPLDAAEIFVGRAPVTEFHDRDGTERVAFPRWRKPVVAIIDEGTRSGLEALAHALKVNGIPLVGAHTARAVVAGMAYLLPDDSLLMLAVSDVTTEGVRLEDTGVEPDIPVERDTRYENGADRQIEAALERILEQF